MSTDRDIVSRGSGQLGNIVHGTTVYDASGDKLGSVHDYNPQVNYLVVQKGLFFPKDLYIPANAVERTTDDGIFLNLYKNAFDGDRYSSPPAAAGRTGATLDGDVDSVTTRRTVATDAQAPTADIATLSRGTVEQRPDRAAASTRRDDLVNPPGHFTPVQDSDLAVPVREEELVARKQLEEVGRVHVHKDVTERQETLNVPVTHEEVRVERIPVDKEMPADQLGADAWQEKDIDVPLMGEQVETGKRAHVSEELRLHKEAVTEQQRVAETVRKERVEVEGVDEQGHPLDLDSGSDARSSRSPKGR